MTLNDIIVSALAQLDRSHDALSLDTWRNKFTDFANEAVLDLAHTLKPMQTEEVQLFGKTLKLSELKRKCIKVEAIVRNGRQLSFSYLNEAELLVPGAAQNAGVDVFYSYSLNRLENSTDVPELPEWCHGLITSYVVARERASGEVNSQRGANIYFQMYEAGKAKLRPHYGDGAGFRLINRW